MLHVLVRFLFAFLLIFPCLLSAQTHFHLPNLAELERRFGSQPNTANASALSYAYLEFAKATVLRKQPDSMQLFLGKSQQTWRRVRPQNAYTQAKYFADMGYFYYGFKREYAVADSFYQLANPWVFKSDSTDFITLTQLELANVYLLRGFKQKGADLIQKWENKVEQVADKKMRSRCFDRLSRFYESIDNIGAMEHAIYYFKRSLAIAQEIEEPGSPRLLAYYAKLETRYEQIGKLDSALLMLQLMEARFSEVDIFRQVWTLMVGASLHIKLNDIQTAKSYLNRAWPMVQANHLEETDDGQYVIFLLGQVAHLEGRLEEAEGYFKLALETCRKADYKRGQRDILEELVKVAEKQGKYSDQARYQKELSEVEVLLAKENYSKAIAEMETEFKVLEKDKQIKEEQATQRLLRLGLILAGLVLGLSAWFYRRLNKQRRALAASNLLIDRQNKELTSLDAAKSRFFANVSHELRTPLALMLGPVGTLLKENQLTEKQAQLLQLAQGSGQQLQQLIADILDLGKLEMGKMDLDEKPTELAAFFRRCLAQFESLAESRQIGFTFGIAVADDAVANLDQAKCRQILNNLLSNAFKFTPSDGKVNVELKMENGEIGSSASPSILNSTFSIQVSDTGPGIHPDDLPHLFDRYFQTTRPDKPAEGGTGIGLALCHEYAQLFGGKIEVESTLGIGSTFRVEFPLTLVRDAGAYSETPVSPKAKPYGETPVSPQTEAVGETGVLPYIATATKPTILVVEDNPDLQAYIRLILSEKYHVVTAENGQAALGMMNDECRMMNTERDTAHSSFITHHSSLPNLILSDLMMPVMDGHQLLERLKSDDATRHIPVIMLTARADVRDKLRALRIGVDDYLLKPFDEEELLARIENLLRNQAARQAAAAADESVAHLEGVPHLSMSQPDREWLENFEGYVQKHYADDTLSVPGLAQAFAMSESTLLRQLKRLTGLSPLQYLLEMRLNEARRLLESRAHNSIAQVAAKVGYEDARSFARSFRQRFGKLPSEV